MMKNELWKVLLDSGLEKEEIQTCRYKLRKKGSPYQEVEGKVTHGGQYIGVNPYIRLYTVLEPLLEDVSFRETEEGKLLFHIITEMMLEIDCYKGYETDTIIMELLETELIAGCFGKEIIQFWTALTKKEKNATLEQLLMLYNSREQIYCFIHEMQEIFPQCVIFRERKTPKIIYVYMGIEKKKELIKKYEAVKYLFLPMDITVYVSWNDPFLLTDIHDMEQLGNKMA